MKFACGCVGVLDKTLGLVRFSKISKTCEKKVEREAKRLSKLFKEKRKR